MVTPGSSAQPTCKPIKSLLSVATEPFLNLYHAIRGAGEQQSRLQTELKVLQKRQKLQDGLTADVFAFLAQRRATPPLPPRSFPEESLSPPPLRLLNHRRKLRGHPADLAGRQVGWSWAVFTGPLTGGSRTSKFVACLAKG